MQVLRFRGTMGALWFWRKRSIWELCIFGQGAEFEKGPRQNGYVNFCFIGAFLSLRFWSATLFFGSLSIPWRRCALIRGSNVGFKFRGSWLTLSSSLHNSQLTIYALLPVSLTSHLGRHWDTDANPAPKSLQSMPQHDLHRSLKDGNGTEYERNRNGLPRSPRHFVCICAFVPFRGSLLCQLFHSIQLFILFCDHTRPSSSPGKSPSVDLAFATSQTM